MSTAHTTADQTVPLGARRATRDTTEPVLGGVAAGLAHHLGLPVLWVRAAFLVAVAVGGFGVVFYGCLWWLLPPQTRFETAAPGIEGATRGGRRPGPLRRLGDLGPAVALGCLGFGLLLLLEAMVGGGLVFWPLVIALAGIGLLWRQADEGQRERWLDSSRRVNPLQAVIGSGWAAHLRFAAGVGLLMVAIFAVGVDRSSLEQARGALVAAALTLAAIAVVVAPYLIRLASDLSAEREERVRSQERADVAAHLHDSVLQTLALIQRNAQDPATVTRLARAQERDLRAWLYADEVDDRTVASALREVAARVEDEYGVSVDVVTVGDTDLLDALRPVVHAAGEALTNAAKHAGTDRVDVYAEVTGGAVDVFVRDRGRGFDPDAVGEDRYGVRHSIVDRMQRHGGTAQIRSAPGEGTEVRLHLPRPERAEENHG